MQLAASVLKNVYGSVAEWSMATVLKTVNGQPFVGSNPTASANQIALRFAVSRAVLSA